MLANESNEKTDQNNKMGEIIDTKDDEISQLKEQVVKLQNESEC